MNFHLICKNQILAKILRISSKTYIVFQYAEQYFVLILKSNLDRKLWFLSKHASRFVRAELDANVTLLLK